MAATRLSRRDAIIALIRAHDEQRPRNAVAYLRFPVQMRAAQWLEIIEALRPITKP